eukprot:COSAG06_NODE_3254_length_5608_cov_2.333999_1_plen_175_part_00
MFHNEKDRFTKTGSGQTQGKHSKRDVCFSQVDTAKAADVAIVCVGDSAEAVGYDGSASTGEKEEETAPCLFLVYVCPEPVVANHDDHCHVKPHTKRRGFPPGEGADRTSIALAGVQLDLINAILATGTPTIIVLIHGARVQHKAGFLRCRLSATTLERSFAKTRSGQFKCNKGL